MLFTRYMPQDVFTASAVTIAMAELAGLSSDQVSGLRKQLITDYRGNYADTNLDADLRAAAEKVTDFLRHHAFQPPRSDEQLAASCKILTAAIAEFQKNGARKTRRGAWFRWHRRELPDRVEAAAKDVLIYHTLLMTGAIDDWQLRHI